MHQSPRERTFIHTHTIYQPSHPMPKVLLKLTDIVEFPIRLRALNTNTVLHVTPPRTPVALTTELYSLYQNGPTRADMTGLQERWQVQTKLLQ
jgi:hypothetical protein